MDLALNILKGHISTVIESYRESGGIDKDTLLVLGFVCFAKILLIDIIFGRSGQLICHFIGFAYPAYRTTKVIESRHQGGESEEHKIQWLMYWVVFASFHLLEFFSDTILGWMPMYWICKSLFLLACMSPLNLCSVIYHVIVLPLFKRSEMMIDNVLADWRHYALTQCTKSLSIDTRYKLLELATLSDSVSPFPCNVNSEMNVSPQDQYNRNTSIEMSSRFEELEILADPATDLKLDISTKANVQSSSFIESSCGILHLETLSDSIILPQTGVKKETINMPLCSIDTSNGLPESPPVSESISPIKSHVKGEVDNSPRPSPKKKRAPPPPQELKINDEDKVEQYLNDNF
jgi:hypothetical protein